MKLSHIALVIASSILIQGCAVNHYSQADLQQKKCEQRAYEQTKEAFIRKKVDVQFAYDEEDVYKAERKYARYIDGINRNFHNCVQKYQRKIFEQELRYQLSYQQ
jgi:hypothetical protein